MGQIVSADCRFLALFRSTQAERKLFDKGTAERMLKLGTFEHLAPDTVIARQDDVVDRLYFILSGNLKVYANDAAGREHVLVLMEHADVFGVLGVLDNQINPHEVVTHGEVEVLTLERTDALMLLETDDGFRKCMFSLMCRRMRDLFTRLQAFALSPARARLAGHLCALAGSHGQPEGRGILIKLARVQETLGAMTGISRQATNKHLKLFEEEGLIEIQNRDLLILDRNSLVRLSAETEDF